MSYKLVRLLEIAIPFDSFALNASLHFSGSSYKTDNIAIGETFGLTDESYARSKALSVYLESFLLNHASSQVSGISFLLFL